MSETVIANTNPHLKLLEIEIGGGVGRDMKVYTKTYPIIAWAVGDPLVFAVTLSGVMRGKENVIYAVQDQDPAKLLKEITDARGQRFDSYADFMQPHYATHEAKFAQTMGVDVQAEKERQESAGKPGYRPLRDPQGLDARGQIGQGPQAWKSVGE